MIKVRYLFNQNSSRKTRNSTQSTLTSKTLDNLCYICQFVLEQSRSSSVLSVCCLLSPENKSNLHVCRHEVFFLWTKKLTKLNSNLYQTNLLQLIIRRNQFHCNFKFETKSPLASRRSLFEFSFRENHKVSSWSAWVPVWAIWLVDSHWLDLALLVVSSQ